MLKRDNFTKNIIERLRARVGNRCSNPNCRVPTTGPASNPLDVNNIGVAAHICAASPGGPRYNPSMSRQERKSINNAIWLCGNCSIKIDRDVKKYSVELLQKWKKSAEKKSNEELGNKLPDDDYVIQSLSTALTGQPANYLPNIVTNACKAASISLENLDPRFSVNTNYINGITQYQIKAKEPVVTKLFVDPKFAHEFNNKLKALYEHGEKLEIDSQAINICGSPLLKKITSQEGRFELSRISKKEFIQKMWLEMPDSKEIYQFYDLTGRVILGSSSLTFNAEMGDKFISTRYRIRQEQLSTSSFNYTFNIDLMKWEGKDIRNLPYFDRTYDFIAKIMEGWPLKLLVEIEGKKLFSGTESDLSKNEQFKWINSHLHYILKIRGICEILDKHLYYSNSYEYSADEHKKIIEIHDILSGDFSIDKEHINGNVNCTLEASEDLLNLRTIIEAKNKPTSLRFVQLENQTISPFSQTLALPKFIHSLSEVVPIVKTDTSKLRPGDLFEVEWEPTENCKYTIVPEYSNS